MEGALLENFNFENIISSSYMTEDKPKDVLDKINEYEKQNDLTKNHKRLKKILEKACV